MQNYREMDFNWEGGTLTRDKVFVGDFKSPGIDIRTTDGTVVSAHLHYDVKIYGATGHNYPSLADLSGGYVQGVTNLAITPSGVYMFEPHMVMDVTSVSGINMNWVPQGGR